MFGSTPWSPGALAVDIIARLNGIEASHIDRHTCRRVVPMKVLVLGASRTGTTSIRQALIALGYDDVYHASSMYARNPPDADMWIEAFEAKFEGKGKPFGREEWDQLLGHCMGVTDTPAVPHFNEDLVDAYPEAKIILSLRDSKEQWWNSVSKTLIPFARYHERQNTFTDQVYRWFKPRMRFDKYHEQLARRGTVKSVEENGAELYTMHNDHVRELVMEKRGGPENYDKECLEYNVKQGWEPLCRFLEKPIPTTPAGKPLPFPRANDSADFQKIDGNLRILMNLLVGLNVVCTMAGIGALVWAFNRYLSVWLNTAA